MRTDLQTKIVAKAWKDPEFKQRLMTNPKAAFKECGLEVSDHLNIKVIEDREDSYTFVLPYLLLKMNFLNQNWRVSLEAYHHGSLGFTD